MSATLDKPVSMNESNPRDPFNNNSYGTLQDSGYLQVTLPVLDVNDFNERIIRGYEEGYGEKELPADLSVARSLIPAGTAFSNRTFRFLAEPRFPSGVDNTQPPEFSILTDAAAAGINPRTGENIGGPASAAAFTSVMGHDVFNPGTNFRDPSGLDNPKLQNGVIFFPGSAPLYKNGVLAGGWGVSGDGVDQNDVVTSIGYVGFEPNLNGVLRADQVFFGGARLPYHKFNRNPEL